eukprot:TRINITY_DN2240_c0_g1_i1.p1 TRINITY_DN2240_c0_g1~~TRINITY_DN2240_c0_g1_i1.p1  ORF type:complete len:308 (+),score=39.93 TRINITY_DN2240_c0_g1_i1:20-943(+)
MSVAIQLDRAGSVYNTGESVKGCVIVTCKGTTAHMGIVLTVEGSVALQLSPKSVGIFEAFYHTIKPLQLISLSITLAEPGKLPDGKTVLPFEFDLRGKKGGPGLFETYHGVFVNVQYLLTVDMQRGMFAKNQRETLPFIVVNPGQSAQNTREVPVPFTLEPKNLRNVKKTGLSAIPNFIISGQLDSAVCDIAKPFTGHIRIEHCDMRIRSIELQLVRVEFCAAAEGVAKEATEIQNIQIAEGDVCRNLSIPIFMVFPRWFTCPTLVANNFKVEFEVNLVVLLEDSHQITENFPVKLYRLPTGGGQSL